MNNKTKPEQKPDIIQWYDKDKDRYVKFKRATGEVVTTKVTPGPYKNIHVAQRRPRVREAVAEVAPVAAPKTTKAASKPTKRKKNYLNNKDMLVELAISNERGEMTDTLAKMLMMLTERYATKVNFSGYPYIDDMKSHALTSLARTWKAFDSTKGSNPFAFFSQCINNSFLQILKIEKHQRNVRDSLLVENGLDPSFTYVEEYNTKMKEERDQRS